MRHHVIKEPLTNTLIRFQDCDPFGHLNNARYLDYFINAREDHLNEHYGLDIYERQKQTSTNWVVAKTTIAYLSPAVFREKVWLRTRLIHYTTALLLMEGEMGGLTHNDLKSIVWIEFRHIDLKQKTPARHSDQLMSLFENIVVPIANTTDFDKRIKEIRYSRDKKVVSEKVSDRIK